VHRLDWLRELGQGSYDLYLSNVSSRTNQQLKVLTFLSAVLLPMSTIASIFGMNFQVRAFTDETYAWLFYAALGGMALISMCLLAYFRLRGWL
jgi:magnesium transporter